MSGYVEPAFCGNKTYCGDQKPKHIIKDSGERKVTETGAQRERLGGKGRYDLISPYMLERLAIHLENGAKKYSDRNWEKGMPLSWYLDAAKRHLNQYHAGMRDEDHLTAIIFNIMALIHTEVMIESGKISKEYDDLPHYDIDVSCPISKEIKVKSIDTFKDM